MVSKIILLSAVVAYVEARFGQEQVPIQAISAVQGGDPGAAATIAGGAISDLLGAANSCAKLATADKIVSDLGGGADAIAAAIGMVTAEKNTNPFANNNTQNVCGDATLPATPELRGITPLIDPDVDANGDVAALSKQTAGAPLDATGKSVFDLLNDAGFGDLVVSQAAAGGAAAGGNADAGNAAAGNDNANQNAGDANANAGSANNATADANAGDNAADNSGAACNAGNAASGSDNANAGSANQTADSGNANADQNAGDAAASNSTGAATGGAASSAGSILTGDEDFGSCTPTIIFEAGQNGRKADEFTFQIADATARGGQQDALNPNIITNALCNQLTNVCGANDAAVTTCGQAKQLVADAGTRDKSTADLFNTALGFAGAVTNPDGGPADKSDAAAAAKRTITRRFKA
ncbi:uncharacterized protein N0V89_006488 [Didymosphaeria variabile]|uniref:Circumsporozoite protein n=1 Tax=Didymosphaeria variabile TaxID=1932322 RepID=A0A9W8XHP6_9PLEO|nr:uncharacterized protein N0V89_006488 [Didymosphaeria variabile]KAJ4351149.1 hypothetical protein N0V89_006488 [Didymosphaeria variabile]